MTARLSCKSCLCVLTVPLAVENLAPSLCVYFVVTTSAATVPQQPQDCEAKLAGVLAVVCSAHAN